MTARTGALSVFGTVLAFGPLRRLALCRIAFTGVEWGAYLSLIVYGYTHGGPAAASAMALIQMIPAALLAPILGAAGERRRPGRVLLVGYLALAAALAIIAAAILMDAPRWVVYRLRAARRHRGHGAAAGGGCARAGGRADPWRAHRDERRQRLDEPA